MMSKRKDATMADEPEITSTHWARPRAAGEGDPSAEANARVVAEIAARCNRPIPYEKLVTRPTAPILYPRDPDAA